MKPGALFFLCWISVFGLNAQNAQQTFEFARLQQSRGETAAALDAYQRVLFFSRDRYAVDCYRALAVLFQENGEYERSAYYYDLLYHAAPHDTVRYEASLGKTAVLLLAQSPRKALIELLSMGTDLPEPWNTRRLLYSGACYYSIRDFASARKSLSELAGANEEKRAELNNLIKKAEKISRKNAKTARVLSMVLPGSGQIYAGDVKNGVNSLLLNAALGVGFVAMAQAYSLTDALLTVAPWLFRYYAGGYKRAGKIVEQKKEDRLKRNFQQILGALSH